MISRIGVAAVAAIVGATRWVAPAEPVTGWGTPMERATRWAAPTGLGPVHDVHVSHTRLVLEGKTIALRIRLFHDDLTLALREFSSRPDLRITPETRADSLFATYFAKVVTLELDGRPVPVQVTASGMEVDEAKQDVVWYVMEGTVPGVPRRLRILNALLFDTWRDQQNIVQLLRLPGEERQTLYFTAADPREQEVGF